MFKTRFTYVFTNFIQQISLPLQLVLILFCGVMCNFEILATGPPTAANARPLGLNRHLRREEAFNPI